MSQSLAHGRLDQDGRRDGPKAGGKAGRRDVPQAGRRDVPQAGRRDVPQAGRRDVPQAGQHLTILGHRAWPVTDAISLHDVTAVGRPTWSPAEPGVATGVHLMRSGYLLRESMGQCELVDATSGTFSHTGLEERSAFPGSGRVRFTFLAMSEEAYALHVAGSDRWQGWRLSIGPELDLRHRRLLAACRTADRLEREERLLDLFDALPPHPGDGGPGPRVSTAVAHWRLATQVRELLNSPDALAAAGLDDLARAVGSSPHHLSRVFRRITGRTITAYRNELRVRAVLEDLAAGADSLADLATRHGFADHSHLVRTVRRFLGETPSMLRRQLSRNVQAAGESAARG
ncbi:AraC family transcriptional regulator [Streptomyces sp. WAC06614]|uniref:helix-turn-helix domain-containing protein n=1 Tax=Streptomyces sp. WAC06614 TaxID=2487416 RepID=UPI000F7AC7E5|nr:AraC family transcriptional regulator [Streptomyces sp. WAC06614]RSS54510.1 AraC family transcriptional regulator [Streptomyces sp. WAC06614]